MKSQDRLSPEREESANQANPEAARPDQSGRGSSPKIRFAHPKGVFRFKTFEEMDAWDAIYKVPIQVK